MENNSEKKGLGELVTPEDLKKFMDLPVQTQAAMADEFMNHIHTLWNRMSDMYNEYILPLAVLGIHLELDVFADDKRITHAECGIKKGIAGMMHELEEKICKENEEE